MGLTLHIQVFKDNQIVGQFEFDSDTNRTIKIGRLNSAQLKLDDPSVARIHAAIEFTGNDFSLVDFGSTIGTLVNGKKIHKVKLSHGDNLQIGDNLAIVGVGGPAPIQQSQPPPPAAQAFPDQTAEYAMDGMFAQTSPGGQQPQQVVTGQMAAPQTVEMPPMAAPVPQADQTMPQQMMDNQTMPSAQPRFDGGAELKPQTLRRISQNHLSSAAVESRPHPALPPEKPLTDENRILEMRVYWGEVLLAMHHYYRPKKITIGETKGTDVFISSEGLPVEVFPLIRYQDDNYVLTFCNGMDGEIEIDNNSIHFNALRGSSMAQRDAELEESYRTNLTMYTRSIVHWGGATFAIRFVSPSVAPPSPMFKNVDLPFINTLVMSVFFHLAGFITLMVYPYDTDSLRVDLFDDPGRFANIIVEGPKETKSTKDLLDRLKKTVEEKKEKLKEEKPELKIATKIKKVKPVKTKQQRQAEVAKKFSKLFSSSSSGGSGSLLGGGGGGSLSGTLSNVIGTAGQGSATAGIAGLGIRGSGPLTGGGIGTSRGIAGIGTAGRLGGGGLGYGSGVRVGKKRDRGMISLSTPVVMGALDPEVIKRVINQNKQQIRYCYEVELQRNQNLEGRLMMQWIIAATGSVAKVKVKESTMRNKNVERCVAAKIRQWQFPRPAGGGIVEVNYPFVFRAG